MAEENTDLELKIDAPDNHELTSTPDANDGLDADIIDKHKKLDDELKANQEDLTHEVTVEHLGAELFDGVCVWTTHRMIPLQRGDYVISVDGVSVTTKEEITDVVRRLTPGETSEIRFIREDKILKVTIPVGAEGWRLEKVVKSFKTQHRRKQTETNDGEGSGKLTCKVCYEGSYVTCDIKGGEVADPKNASSYVITMKIGDDKKKCPPVKTKKFKNKKGVFTLDEELKLKMRFGDLKDRVLEVNVKEPKMFGAARVLCGLRLDLNQLSEDYHEGMDYTYDLHNDSFAGAVEKPRKASEEQHKKDHQDITDARPALDMKFFDCDGLCVRSVKPLSPIALANLRPGDVLVGILGMEEKFESENFKHALHSVTHLQLAVDEHQRPLSSNDITDRVEVQLVSFRPILQNSIYVELVSQPLVINDRALQQAIGAGADEADDMHLQTSQDVMADLRKSLNLGRDVSYDAAVDYLQQEDAAVLADEGDGASDGDGERA